MFSSTVQNPRRGRRRVLAATLGLALVAGPAVTAGTEGAHAAGLKRAKATYTATVTVTARRTVATSMKATVVATVPKVGIAPIRVSMVASATRSATAAVSSTGRKTATARAATAKKAAGKARAQARKGARAIAERRAAALATSSATTKARSAAYGAARSDAIAKAKASAVERAKAVAPEVTVTPQLVAVDTAAAPCGGMKPARVGGGTYSTCTFDDNFSGGVLDSTKWSAMDTTKVNFKIGDECFDPNNVSVTAGLLNLTGTKSAVSRTCAGRSTSYNSGLVSTKGLFSQAYGRFEMRAKFPKGYGYGSGFWMLPENPYSSGAYKYGEIDIVENWGQYSNLMWAHVHYVYTPGNLVSGKACSINADGETFHTYGVDWSPTQMTFLYDGNPCWTTTWKPAYPYAPAGAKAPAPFDQPFYMILNLSLGGTTSTATNPLSATPMGKSMQVDWVRAWK